MRDVVGLYLHPPERAVVLCIDENSQIQALDRTQPMLPLPPGLPARRTHDYNRNGTATLSAALEFATGKITTACHPRHLRVERRRDLAEQPLGRRLRPPHVPLPPVHHRRPGEVRRADIGGAEPRAAVEDPRLGVQPGDGRVVRDADVEAAVAELVEGAGFGGARVGGRQQHRHAAVEAACSSSRTSRTPYQRTKATMRSTRSAEASSFLISAARCAHRGR
jgi:hypothetical protein